MRNLELHDLHGHEGHGEAYFLDFEIVRSDRILPRISEAMETFEDWMETFVLVEPAERYRLLEEGVLLARSRSRKLSQIATGMNRRFTSEGSYLLHFGLFGSELSLHQLLLSRYGSRCDGVWSYFPLGWSKVELGLI